MTAAQIVTALTVPWVLTVASPLYAASHNSDRLLCKRVREAVWAGHTLAQLTAEFDMDAAHIMKCVQSRKGKKPKTPHTKTAGAAGAHETKKK